MSLKHQTRRSRPAVLLAGLVALAAISAGAPDGACASRIVTRAESRTVVAVSPNRGRPSVLFHRERGTILSVGASADGRTIAVATREARGHSRTIGSRVDRIWLMDGDGRHPHVVHSFGARRNRGGIDAIALSPDGSRLLVTIRSGEAKVDAYLLRVDGMGVRKVQLTGEWGFACGLECENTSGPEFTPNGKRILGTFSSTIPHSRQRGIGIVRLRGGPIHFLRRGPSGTLRGSGFAPTMAPDESRIAFVVGDGRTSRTRLMIMRSDGTRAHPVPNGRLPGKTLANPSFSPSGNALAFAATELNRIGGTDGATVFVIGCDGAGRRLVERGTTEFYGQNPVWTPGSTSDRPWSERRSSAIR